MSIVPPANSVWHGPRLVRPAAECGRAVSGAKSGQTPRITGLQCVCSYRAPRWNDNAVCIYRRRATSACYGPRSLGADFAPAADGRLPRRGNAGRYGLRQQRPEHGVRRSPAARMTDNRSSAAEAATATAGPRIGKGPSAYRSIAAPSQRNRVRSDIALQRRERACRCAATSEGHPGSRQSVAARSAIYSLGDDRFTLLAQHFGTLVRVDVGNRGRSMLA